MPALNESALAGLTPERAAEIRAKVAADGAAKKAANAEKYGPMPDPKTDPEGWKYATFRYMYQVLRRLMAARTKTEPDNAAVKRVWNALMDARPDLIGADTETIRQAFDAEHAAERAERQDEAAEIKRKADEYLAAHAKPNPIEAPRQKRIGGQPTSRKLSEIMQEFPMPTKSVFPPLPAEKPATPKPPVDPELAAAFPRDAAGNPIPDDQLTAGEAESAMIDADPAIPPSPRVVAPTPRWQDDPAKMDGFRKAVFAEITRTYGEGAINAQGVNEIVRAALGCAVDEWAGSGSEALGKIKAHLKAQQPPDEPPAEIVAETAQNGAENTPPAMVTPKPAETPRHAPKTGQIEKANGHTAITRYEPVPATPETAGWAVEMQRAQMLLDSGFLPPSVKTVAQVFYLIEMAKLLEVPLLAAINGIDVINNRIHLKPVMMMGLINRSKQLDQLEIKMGEGICTVVMTRKGKAPHTETFSKQNAIDMGIWGKDNWRKQPDTMLKWRAISAAARVVFPDVIWGLYLTEEIQPDLAVISADYQ